ncbi:MAG: hypothetical protein E4G89_06075, partial [Methanothrix sp.]
MAYKNQDWGSIFDPNIPQAIPVPEVQESPDDWGSIFTNQTPLSKPIVPYAIPEVPNEQRKGWESLEIATPAIEGVKQVGSMFKSAWGSLSEVVGDVGRRGMGVANIPEGYDVSTLPEGVQFRLKLAQGGESLVKYLSLVTNPMYLMLTAIDNEGALDADMEYYQRLEGKKDEVQIAENVIVAAPQLITNILAGMTLGPAGVAATSFTQIYGSQYQRHKENHNPTEASSLAMIDAIPQAALESFSTIFLLGGTSVFKKMLSPKVLNQLSKTLNSKSAKWIQQQSDTIIGRLAGSAAMEGAEEYAQSITEVLSDYVSLRMRGLKPTGEDIGRLFAQKHKEGKRGAIVGGILGGGAGGISAAVQKKANALKNANPEVTPETPDKVNRKEDALTILEQASERLATQAAEAEAAMVIPEQVIPEQQPAPLLTDADVAPGPLVIDGNIDNIIDNVLSAPDEDVQDIGPTYKERLESGELTPDQARIFHEEEFLSTPSARPEWSSQRSAVVEP